MCAGTQVGPSQLSTPLPQLGASLLGSSRPVLCHLVAEFWVLPVRTGCVISSRAEDSWWLVSNLACALELAAGGEGTAPTPHFPSFLKQKPPSGTVWVPHPPPVSRARAFSLARVAAAAGSTRGGSSAGSPVGEMSLQCLAGLADKNKMFALAICLVLKTFLDNARALVRK